MSLSIIGNLLLSGKNTTEREIRILKSKNRHIKNNGYDTDYEKWAESIKDIAFEKCHKCHFVKKYKGADIYDVDVEVAGYSETKKGDTIYTTVRIYQTQDSFVARIVAYGNTNGK